MNIPRDKDHPADAVQCDECGGHGVRGTASVCSVCGGKGWLSADHPNGRRCYRDTCNNPIPPAQVAVYCTDRCAFDDAGPSPGMPW